MRHWQLVRGPSAHRGTWIATCTLTLTLTPTPTLTLTLTLTPALTLTLTLTLARHLERHVESGEVEAAGGQGLGRRALPAGYLPALLWHLLDRVRTAPLHLAGLEVRRVHRAPQPQVERLERLAAQARALGGGEGRAGRRVGEEEAEQVEAAHEGLEEGGRIRLG